MPRVMQLLEAGSPFIAQHPAGPLGFFSESVGSFRLTEMWCMARQTTKLVQWDSATSILSIRGLGFSRQWEVGHR